MPNTTLELIPGSNMLSNPKPRTTTSQKFPFDQAESSILTTIPQVKKVKFIKTEDGALDGIRILSDGSIPDKTVSTRIAAALLLDMDYQVDHRIIHVISRPE